MLYSAFTQEGVSGKKINQLLFDIEYKRLLNSNFDDAILKIILKIFPNELFLKNDKAAKLILFIGNQFETLSNHQAEEVYDALMAVSLNVQNPLLKHVIGDYIAQNYKHQDALRFCNEVISKVASFEDTYKTQTKPIVSSIIFCLRKEVENFSTSEIKIFNNIEYWLSI